MNNKINTYALIMALFDNSKDYIDTFIPLVLRIFNKGSCFSIEDTQKEVLEKFSIEIPILVLKTILRRARKEGLVTQRGEESKYCLSDSGWDISPQQEEEKDIEREINALIKAVVEFFEKREVEIDMNQAKTTLFGFVDRNFQEMVNFFNPQISSEVKGCQGDKKTNEVLIEFIKDINSSNPDLYKTLKKIVFGSIILSALCLPDSSEREHLYREGFGGIVLYVDTNILFSMFGFHTSEYNRAAEELLELLKELDIEIRVFDFTVQEAASLLSLYSNEEHKYFKSFEVDSIYSAIKNKGWNSGKLESFIATIDKTIEHKGIIVDYDTGFEGELKDYQPKTEGLDDLFVLYKPDQPIVSRRHDEFAIDQIRTLRKRRHYNIKDAKYFFLTADAGLHSIAFDGLGHKKNKTVAEVFLDRVLAGLLWFKNSKSDLPIKTILATHSRGFLVDARVWNKFFENIEELEKEGKIDSAGIASVFYGRHAKKELLNVGQEEVSKGFTLQIVEDSLREQEEKDKEGTRHLEKVQQEKKEVVSALSRARAHKEKIVLSISGKEKAKTYSDLRRKTSKLLHKKWNLIHVVIGVFYAVFLYLVWLILVKVGWSEQNVPTSIFGGLVTSFIVGWFATLFWNRAGAVNKISKWIANILLGKREEDF